MTSQERAFAEFAEFAARLKGDEKSEAQTFLFHLLEAFGHEANTLPPGTIFEYRARFSGDRTKLADLVWSQWVLIEIKSRGGRFAAVHYFTGARLVRPAPAHEVGKAGAGPRLRATRDYPISLLQAN